MVSSAMTRRVLPKARINRLSIFEEPGEPWNMTSGVPPCPAMR